MRNLKKVLSLALAMVMLVGMMVMGAGAADFKDENLIGDKYKEAIDVMAALKIFEGDTQGNLKPQAILDRASAAKLVAVMMLGNASKGLESTKKSNFFSDMSDHWASGYVDYCASVGIVEGSNGTFNPNGKLTYTAFATMMLRAAGAETITGAGWEAQAVAAAAKYGIEDVTAGKELTREAAAKMTLEGLLVSPSGEQCYSVVGDDGKTHTFTSAADAYFYAQGQTGNPVVNLTTAKDSLAAKNFNLAKNDVTDDFGRPTTSWTAKGGVKVELTSSAPVQTYNGVVKASDIYKDLGLTSAVVCNAAEGNSNHWYYDGRYFSWDATPAHTTHPVLPDSFKVDLSKNSTQKLGNNTSTTEVYYDGTTVSIVTYDTYPGKIAKVNEAKDGDPATVEVNVWFPAGNYVEGLIFEGEGYEKDQYVLVTITRTPDGRDTTDPVVYTIQSLEAATILEDAKVTAYSSDKVTADGTAYEYASTAKLRDSLNKTNYAMTSRTYTFVLDQNNRVILAENYTASAVVPTNFALITAVDATETGSFGSYVSNVKVRAILADGTAGVYNLKLDSAKKPWSGASAIENTRSEGAITTEIQQNAEDLLLATGEPKAYGYTLDGDTITLIPLKTSLSTGNNTDAVQGALSSNYTVGHTSGDMSTPASGTGLFTDKTVYVTYTKGNATKGDTVVSTETPAKNVTINSAKAILVLVSTKTTNVGSVSVVFLESDGATAAAAGYAYVDPAKTEKRLVNGSEVTFYTGKTTGEDVALSEATGVTAAKGVWAYNSDNEITGDALPEDAATVVGTQISVNDAWYNTNEDTQIVYLNDSLKELSDASGKQCVVIDTNSDGVADIIFVDVPST